MPDTKITALTAITTVDPAVDVLPIVDVSDTTMAASGTTKKITSNQILGAGGTATLASATITGNLTVDTSTFAVDASNNRVFVGTAPISTAYPFYVTRGGTAGSIAQFTDGTAQTLTIDSAAGGLIVGNANNGYLEFVANGLAQYRIAPLGVFSWYDGAGGTRMTLNSTGLGVGGSPVEKLTVAGDAEITGGVVGQGCYLFRDGSSGGGNYSAKTGNVSLSAPASGTLRFNVNNGTFAGQFDTSGNLILSATSTPPTLTINGQLVVNATSNTNLRFSYRGSDGVTRVANITLA